MAAAGLALLAGMDAATPALASIGTIEADHPARYVRSSPRSRAQRATSPPRSTRRAGPHTGAVIWLPSGGPAAIEGPAGTVSSLHLACAAGDPPTAASRGAATHARGTAHRALRCAGGALHQPRWPGLRRRTGSGRRRLLYPEGPCSSTSAWT